MPASRVTEVPVQRPDRLFIGGDWVEPSSPGYFDVIDPTTEESFLRIAKASPDDIDRAVGAARLAFDQGPWPRMAPEKRAEYLNDFAREILVRSEDFVQVWVRECGGLPGLVRQVTGNASDAFKDTAKLLELTSLIEEVTPTPTFLPGGDFGLRVREPVGVVAAIVAFNGPLIMAALKVAPALLAGCTVILKSPPESPAEGYILAEIAESIGLPPGVFNVVTADREVSERLVADPRVDKVTLTGSSAAGRRVGQICADRVARVTLELGGKSAAVVLDDADIGQAAAMLGATACIMTGQTCASLTRVIVSRHRHDEMAEALAAVLGAVRVGDPFDESTQMGPLVTRQHLERVQRHIATGIAEGARLAVGGGRPKHLDRGWFIEPTVFAGVNNSDTIAQEEIFGPVVSIIPADNERHAVELANDTIYGLNATVFTPDADRAYSVARRLRTGTVGHNALRADYGVAFGGFKQSGLGREGGVEGLLAYTETKVVLLDAAPTNLAAPQ
jgi:aldehyde dehydrogenase (NAD+)